MDMSNRNWFNALSVFVVVFIALGALQPSCKGGENIGLDGDDGRLGVHAVDTFTVAASTYLLDPLPTAATGSMLVGGLQDGDLGGLSLSSYFTVSNAGLSISELPTDAVFDSLSLTLLYTKYFYGDTSQQFGLALHRLLEDVELAALPIALEDDEYPVFVSGETLWSDQRFAYGASPVGKVVCSPRPNTVNDTIKIKLDEALGRELFELAKSNDTRLTNSDDFADFLKGFVLVPEAAAACVIGLRDTLALNLHYSYERQTDGRRVSDTLVFGIGSTSYQFNHAQADREATALANLSYSQPEIPASLTGQQTFIQGTSGIVTRLRFPSAKEFVNDGNIAVSKAQLIIETDQSAYGTFAPPASLIMMVANQYGTPTSLLSASYGDGSSQTGYYQSPGQAGGAGNGRYVFDLTQYLSEMRNGTGSEAESLLLSLPTAGLMGTVNRLGIASNGDRPAIKLNLVYVKF